MGDGFVGTHVVRQDVSAWDRPDGNADPVSSLWAGLPVVVVERQGEWARIRCENDWEAWTDARVLDPVTPAPAGSGDDVVRQLNGALSAYEGLITDREAGRIDEETFRRSALKTGLVVRDTDAWLLDLPSGRWWRYDGVQLSSIELGPVAPEGQA